MALKFKAKTKDEIPTELQSLYGEGGGGPSSPTTRCPFSQRKLLTPSNRHPKLLVKPHKPWCYSRMRSGDNHRHCARNGERLAKTVVVWQLIKDNYDELGCGRCSAFSMDSR